MRRRPQPDLKAQEPARGAGLSLDTPQSKMNHQINTSASEGVGGRLKTTADLQSQGLGGKVLFMCAKKDSEGKAVYPPQESPAAEGGGSRMPCALHSPEGLLEACSLYMMEGQFRV